MANSFTKFKIQIIEARKQNTRRKLECCTAWVPFLQFSQKNNHSCIKLRLHSISKNDIIPHILYSLHCYYTLKTSSKIQRVEISHAVLMDKSLQAVQEQFPDVIKHLDNTEMLLHQILSFNSQILYKKSSAKRRQNFSSNVLRGTIVCKNNNPLKYSCLYKLLHVKYSERVLAIQLLVVVTKFRRVILLLF